MNENENNVVIEEPGIEYAVSGTPPPSPRSVLAFGILALALSETVIFGLIFGFIARSKAKKYAKAGVEYPGQVKAGKTLALVGIILSFIALAVYILYFALFASMMSLAVSQGIQ